MIVDLSPNLANTATANAVDHRRALRQLIANVSVGMAITAFVLIAMVYLSGSPQWWRGLAGATVASLLAAGASFVPIAIGLRRGYAGIMSGFMASSAVRMAVALGVASFAVVVGDFPKIPTIALVLPYYIATLVAEAFSLTRLPKIATASDAKA